MAHIDPKFLDQILLHANGLDDIELRKVHSALKDFSLVVLRGLIQTEDVQKVRKSLSENFDPTLDQPGTGETPGQIMSTFQKLSIGGERPNQVIQSKGRFHGGVHRPRFMRTFYTPFWEEDGFCIHPVLEKVCQIRNLVYGFPTNFCIREPEKGFWTAARIHHYPAGGGFMGSHHDEALPLIQRENNISQYYQPLLIMSEKGKDFHDGGGFVVINHEKFYYENFCQLGDVVIYNGKTQHGVEDIDPQKKLSLKSINGRLAAFVSLFKDLR